VQFDSAVPIMRMFDEAKAKEFYVGFLGFKVDWEHRLEPGTPLYMQLSLGDCVIHLSEHHGDSTPGSRVRVRVDALDAYHAQITAKGYKYNRPGIQDQSWGDREMMANDPFGSVIVFYQPMEQS
jgi:uncharacterized glyoxalase superfamily protein PhnB